MSATRAGWRIAVDDVHSGRNPIPTILKHYKTPCSINVAASHVRSATGYPVDVRKQSLKCRRLLKTNVENKNEDVLIVDGNSLLLRAKEILEYPDDEDKYAIILALLLVSGRRTAEIVNGKSVFSKLGSHSAMFKGQLKTKRKVSYEIPLLVPYDVFENGLNALRNNTKNSKNVQGGLSVYSKRHFPFSKLNRVHDLRAIYAHIVYKLYKYPKKNTCIQFCCNACAGTYKYYRLYCVHTLSGEYIPQN